MASESKSSPALIFLAWLFVGVPAGWGVYNTMHSSMKLFQNTPPATQPATQAPSK
jgi:hypothetical protein